VRFIILFQSLFYWKYHFNTEEIAAKKLEEYCFNPYFTGSTTSTTLLAPTVARALVFQSLFYWKYHFNIIENLKIGTMLLVSILILLEVPLQPTRVTFFKLALEGFNPYFTGSTTSTLYVGGETTLKV